MREWDPGWQAPLETLDEGEGALPGQPVEEAATNDDDDWISRHAPVIDGMPVEL